MREAIRDAGRLQHMLEHIDRAKQFMEGKTLADLEYLYCYFDGDSETKLKYMFKRHKNYDKRFWRGMYLFVFGNSLLC